MIAFEVGHAIPLQNAWQRWHWRKRQRYVQQLAWEIRAQLKRIPKRPWDRVTVSIARFSIWRGIAPDVDALVTKPVLDVLQPRSKRHPYGLGVIADDSRDVVTKLATAVKRGPAKTVVIVTEV